MAKCWVLLSVRAGGSWWPGAGATPWVGPAVEFVDVGIANGMAANSSRMAVR